ncbi:hypothetical protein AXG93_1988s1250 [Marchantia polymorpha subsp. ruderalis]|uniref:60S ribosomal protein L35 n=1 Tax=Marchantia polymorpha subsp. ruderalis TaxID=1480154 RepID=A0A176VVI8_MARPO|nr:hypothetical protein AXG93_1988s1250 [Marchantia polymorpha subsp. ruderalis]
MLLAVPAGINRVQRSGLTKVADPNFERGIAQIDTSLLAEGAGGRQQIHHRRGSSSPRLFISRAEAAVLFRSHSLLRPSLAGSFLAKWHFGNHGKVVRLSIAQVLTVISQTQKAHLREVYKKKSFLPLDLRPKKTRAIRKRLTLHQASLKTEKQQKKDAYFPMRKYAVKA